MRPHPNHMAKRSKYLAVLDRQIDEALLDKVRAEGNLASCLTRIEDLRRIRAELEKAGTKTKPRTTTRNTGSAINAKSTPPPPGFANVV